MCGLCSEFQNYSIYSSLKPTPDKIVWLICSYFFFVGIISITEMLKSSSQKRNQEEDKNFKSEPSFSPLHQATIAGDDAAVEVLLINGADRFAKDIKVGHNFRYVNKC